MVRPDGPPALLRPRCLRAEVRSCIVTVRSVLWKMGFVRGSFTARNVWRNHCGSCSHEAVEGECM